MSKNGAATKAALEEVAVFKIKLFKFSKCIFLGKVLQ